MTVYATAWNSRGTTYNIGYDGKTFFYASFNPQRLATGEFSSDGMRREYEQVGWVNLGTLAEEKVPADVRERLLALYAEAQADAKKTAPTPSFEEREETNRQKAERERIPNADLTIAGKTLPRCKWQEGASINIAPSAEDIELIEAEGLEVWKESRWRIIGEPSENQNIVFLLGKKLPRNDQIGRSTTKEPTPEEITELSSYGLSFEETTIWNIYEPRPEGYWE